tara:strand:+ start:22075 stop:23139 length:1065 start_codon:yes stop_codon:yes gene_type:complete
MVFLEYIWIGGNNELRSKVKVKDGWGGYEINDLNHNFDFDKEGIYEWNYDGSSTNQASGEDSEIIIKPKAIYKNPFKHPNSYHDSYHDSYLILCDTYLPNGEPHKTNTRVIAEKIFTENNVEKEKPLFGIEHEFFVIDNSTNKPLGFPISKDPEPQGPYYCSVGTRNCFGRDFLYEVLEKCIKAGINCTGCNLEVCLGQMEIQICSEGIKAGDDSIMFKYIVHRLGEKYNYIIDFSAKPVKGDWNGSGCHVNFSTASMRKEGGSVNIMKAIGKLQNKHQEHIELYGDDNIDRLTGKHETSDINTFTSGVANRGASIRIPNSTFINKCGYFEDRRPSSSADMYLVTSKLFKTCVE